MNMVLEELVAALDVRPTRDLRSHEQTIPENMRRMKDLLLNTGQLVDPLIVDRATNVVLDGNHRLNVLNMIGCPLAVCQLVDYASSGITVGTWLPATVQPMEQLLEGKAIRQERMAAEAGRRELQTRNVPFVAMQQTASEAGACTTVTLDAGSYGLAEMLDAQQRTLKALGNIPWEYIPDDMADQYLARGYAILFRRSFSKDEIVQSARAGRPFPPKSTRHLIPSRIIRLNMKLGWMHGTREEALRSMRRMLETRVYEGNVRRYFEPVTVIY